MHPIGKFAFSENLTFEEIQKAVEELKKYPSQLLETVGALTSEELGSKTGPGKWTIAQVVNHVADSHLNMFVRVKLLLTEDNPTIKPYNETLWAELLDGKNPDIKDSLNIISSIHRKLTNLLASLPEDAFQRTYYHPQSDRKYPLGEVCRLYAWHGKHHLAFIQEALNNA